MRNFFLKNILIFLTLTASLFLFKGNTQMGSEGYLSPETVIADDAGKFVYVALKEARSVLVIDAQTNKITKKIDVIQSPTGMAMSQTESKLFVTGGVEKGEIYKIDPASGKTDFKISVGYGPLSPVITNDGKLLYVPNRFDNNISVVDLNRRVVIKNIPVHREPFAAVLSKDSRTLYVGHLIPDSRSDSGFVAAKISVINTSDNVGLNEIDLPNGSTGIREMVISPDGKYLYITHLIGFFNLPTSQLERGWMNTNVFSIIDTEFQKVVSSILLDDLDSGASNPWGITLSSDGNLLIITHAGTNEVSIIDRKGLHNELSRRNEKISDDLNIDASNDFSFLTRLRHRVILKGTGPRGVAVARDKIFVGEYYSGSLGIIDLVDTDNVQSKSLGKEPEIGIERRGEIFFNDATTCFQSWQSCASCHPDVRMDGLNWDLLNDGVGNPKNTKSLLLSHETPPVMSLGVRAMAEVAVRSGFKYILFASPDEKDAIAVDAYLKSLSPLPSPYLVNGQMSKRAKTGKKIFEKAGCQDCHSGTYYTNMKSYDVGTMRIWDTRKEKPLLDVPSLIEVWRTKPYLHDGRAIKVEEAFGSCNPEGVKGLTSVEIKALAEFVLSL